MATVALDRQCRMDFRISEGHKAEIERAAAMRGMSLTQWMTMHLVEDARADIESQASTWLSAESFDLLAEALDQPMNDRAREFLEAGDRWSR